jgi:hypothetical protein
MLCWDLSCQSYWQGYIVRLFKHKDDVLKRLLCFYFATLFCHALNAQIRDRHLYFLLGGEMGYERQKEEFTTHYIAPTVLPLPITSYDNQSETISDRGTFLGLLAGLQYRLGRVLIGIEGNLDFNSFYQPSFFVFNTPNNVNTDVFSATAFYKRGPVLGLTGRAGWFVTPGFMPYVRLGAQVSHDEGSYQVVAGVNQVRDYSERSKQIYGVVGGIGVELPTFIGPSTLRFEYTYSCTQSLTIVDNQPPILGTNRFPSPVTNAFKVAWVWNI